MSKDGKKVLLLGLFSMALVLAGCDSDGGSGNAQQLSATAANFDEVIRSVIDKPGNYVINLTGDLIDYPGIVMQTAGVNITVKVTGSNKITWKYTAEANCSLFNVYAGKLTLENINLNRGAFSTPDWNVLWISGGTIGKSVNLGMYLNGAGAGFEKKKGGVIYDNSGDNKNDGGAIHVLCAKNEKNSLNLEGDAGKDEVYAAKINSEQTDIVAGSKQGPNW